MCYVLHYFKVAHAFPGPKRSTLQAMLANLSEADDMSLSQTGAASSHQNSMSEVDDLGMHGYHMIINKLIALIFIPSTFFF